MGRKRRNNTLGLPERVYAKHGAFYYVHRDGRWERLGTDIAEARRKGNLYSDPQDAYGTMAHYLDAFVVHCEERVRRKDLALQSCTEYKRNIGTLKIFFGKMTPVGVEPKHVAQYLDMGASLNRPVRANREKSCLSACFSWLVRKGEGGVKTNPCIGVRRNRETKRVRYVEDEEYAAVYAVAVRPVQTLMALLYRTLQRPEDILKWTRTNIVAKRENDRTLRVLRNVQKKTGTVVDIEVTPEIESILKGAFESTTSTLHTPFVHRRDGKAYTYSGLTAMLDRYMVKTNVNPFGFYDLKAKGATDMWQSGVPLEQIQALCGHASRTTTEIYVKRHWQATVRPNQVKMLSNMSNETT